MIVGKGSRSARFLQLLASCAASAGCAGKTSHEIAPDAPTGLCPTAPPANGDPGCAPIASELTDGGSYALCSWGDHPVPICRTTARCGMAGEWLVTPPADGCSSLPAGCPASPSELCTRTDEWCYYATGDSQSAMSLCVQAGHAPISELTVDLTHCPSVAPNAGMPCSLSSGDASCGFIYCWQNYRDFAITCQNGYFSWNSDIDERCYPVCAAPDTPIATPEGERPIAEIQLGELVYSVDHEAVVPVPVERVYRHAAVNHHVVRVHLESGRLLDVSAPHPTADGRTFGDLRVGTRLDGVLVVAVESIAYLHPYTYDILPASSTRSYFAAGARIGSTLAPSSASSDPSPGAGLAR